MAARYGGREARLLEAGLALAQDRQLPAVFRRLVALAAELTGARWCGVGVFGADKLVVDVIATGSRDPEQPAAASGPKRAAEAAEPERAAEAPESERAAEAPESEPRRAVLPAPGPGVLRIPVMIQDAPFGDLCVAGKREAVDFDEDDQLALETLAAYASVAIENATLLMEAEGRARRLEALREVAARLLAGPQLDDLLVLIASHAMLLARADGCTVLIPGAREGTLVIDAAVGIAGDLRGLEVPIDQSVAGEVIQTGKTEVVANLSADSRTFPPAAERGISGSAMYLPLRARQEPFGALVVVRRVGAVAFGESDVELVEGFADLAAVAFEYISVHRELRRLAVLEERERIARELHDGAIQALFAVGMGLQATAARTGEPEVTRRLHGAVGELDRVISDLRSYIFGLRPGVLAGRHIDQALRRLAEETAMPAGVTTVVEVEEQVAAALSQHAGELVQVVREALSNVVRHARATTCRVSLYWRQGSVGGLPGRIAVLEVDDDGVGFDPRASRPGHGLGNLSARAAALGGSLELESSSGEGTTVRVLIPL
jgi:signal transduction histidine kinase